MGIFRRRRPIEDLRIDPKALPAVHELDRDPGGGAQGVEGDGGPTGLVEATARRRGGMLGAPLRDLLPPKPGGGLPQPAEGPFEDD